MTDATAEIVLFPATARRGWARRTALTLDGMPAERQQAQLRKLLEAEGRAMVWHRLNLEAGERHLRQLWWMTLDELNRLDEAQRRA